MTDITGATFDIVCEGLVRIFTAQGVEVQALQGLDLTVRQGEMVALVGASGSGKSTLLGILSGSDTPSAGRAHVSGHDLVAMRGRERLDYRRRTVGFVWQQSARNLLPYLTARQNVAMVHAVAGVIAKDRQAAQADELLDSSGSLTSPTGTPRSCRAGRTSGSRSRWPWPTSRRCCWPTNRPASSTSRPAPKCSPPWSARTASGQ